MVAGGAPPIPTTAAVWPKVFLSAAAKRPMLTKSKTQTAGHRPHFGVATTVEVDGEVKDRDIDEIALEVAEKALNEWGKAEGELLYLKRAPGSRSMRNGKTGCTSAQHRP
jgi:carbon-monoxide dehydrogenase catalytic subunit